jgi:predicted nucleic acid-binding protein
MCITSEVFICFRGQMSNRRFAQPIASPKYTQPITRLPGKHRASGQQAVTFLEMIQERFSFVALDVADYLATIRELAALGIVGGTTYDALVAACALKAKADVLYTWNIGHFLLLGDELARKVRKP